MKRLYILLTLIITAFIFASCASKDVKQINAVSSQEVMASGIGDSSYIELSKLNEKVWVHTSYSDYNGNRTPSNGMIVISSDGLVLIDTPWNNEQTRELIKLTKEKFNQDIALAMITHAHEDRIGGIDTLLQNKIVVISTELTAQQAVRNGYEKPASDLDSNPNIKLGDIDIETFYPGEGHSSDNITVWISKYKILFGGCLFKSLEADNLGSIADANLVQWPASVEKVKERYSDAEIVIPGHGKWGGIELVNHTLDLLKRTAQ